MRLALALLAAYTGAGCGAALEGGLPASADPEAEVSGDASEPIAAGGDEASLSAAANAVMVSPSGSDTTGTGTAHLPFKSLERALQFYTSQKQLGAVMATFTITLLPGTYALANTLALTPAHSGLSAGAPLVIRAQTPGTVTLSGGFAVGNFAVAEDGLWRAPLTDLAPGTELRQLWVNGQRAVRAASKGALGLVDQSCQGTSATTRACQDGGPAYYLGPYKVSLTAAKTLAGWKGLRRVEVVNNDSYKQSRCLVDRVVGEFVYMQEPCWSDAHATSNNGSYNSITPVRLENARELLDEPGEWYFDAGERVVYYRPRAGETLASVVAFAPRLERLVTVSGTPSAPVHDVRFSGLSFAHATWLRPSTGAGFAEYQANQLVSRTGDFFPAAAVTLSSTRRVVFTGGSFVHLGGVGLDLGTDASYGEVSNNLFTDISSAALFLGSRLDPAAVSASNTVEQNLIFAVGAEYQGAPAIVAGFTQRLTLQNNEIHDVPYTGISLGWGWGLSSATGNVLKANEILRHMQVMDDGGGIYTLGDQPGTSITGNFISNPAHGYGGIYLDDCTSRVLVQANVVWVDDRPSGVTLGGVVSKGFSNTVTGNSLNDLDGTGTGVISFTQASSTCSAKAALNGQNNSVTANVTLTSLADAPGSLVAAAGRTGPSLFSATISVSPTTVQQGQAAIITWSSVNASFCGSTGGFSTGGAISGRASTGLLIGTKSFQVVCTGPGGSISSNTATVTVVPR